MMLIIMGTVKLFAVGRGSITCRIAHFRINAISLKVKRERVSHYSTRRGANSSIYLLYKEIYVNVCVCIDSLNMEKFWCSNGFIPIVKRRSHG